MKLEILIEQIGRLYDNYQNDVRQDIKDRKIAEFLKEFNGVSDARFVQAVDLLRRDENVRKFPTISQIWNYIKQIKQDAQHSVFCDKCDKTGYYTLWQYRENLNGYYAFAYRCVCNKEQIGMPFIGMDNTPLKAHNPFPTNDKRHEEFNKKIAV